MVFIKVDSTARYRHDRMLKKILPSLRKMDGVVLDVGGGPRLYSDLLKPMKYESLDSMKEVHPDHCMDITEEIPNKKFDLVTTFQCLEHIREPDAAIRNMSRTLKTSGILVGSTPFMWHYHSNKEYLDYYRYTEDGLRYLFEKYFGTVEILPFGNSVLTFTRACGRVPFFGIPFNMCAKLIEFVFSKNSRYYPSGYIFICRDPKTTR